MSFTIDKEISEEMTKSMRRCAEGDFKLDRLIPKSVEAYYLLVTHDRNATWGIDFIKAFNRLKKKGYELNQITVHIEYKRKYPSFFLAA